MARSRALPLAGLFLGAFVIRIAVFVTASHVYHIPLNAYAAKGDGASYLACAKAVLGNRSELTDYDRRVFPGYPALIALVRVTGIPLSLSALFVDWVSAGVAAAGAYALFSDRRVGWAMIFLLPHYLANSSLAMSEAPLLALSVTGALLTQRERPIAGGIVLGLACLVRPMGCFAAAGAVVAAMSERRLGRSVIVGVCVAVVAGGGLLVARVLTDGAVAAVGVYRDSPRAYGGSIFRPPFYSLLSTPRTEHVHAGFIIYIYAHVLVVLLACVLLGYRTFKRGAQGDREERDHSVKVLNVLTLTWLVGNTLFQLCIGSTWGFRHFPRFAIASQPALFWALLPILPRRPWPWVLAGSGVFYMAVVCVYLSP